MRSRTASRRADPGRFASSRRLHGKASSQSRRSLSSGRDGSGLGGFGYGGSGEGFSEKRSRPVNPVGIVLAILATFLAVPVLTSGGAEGSADRILAASMTLPEKAAPPVLADSPESEESLTESTSSSLFGRSTTDSIFEAGARAEVPVESSSDLGLPPTSELSLPEAGPSETAPATSLPQVVESESEPSPSQAPPATPPPATAPPATAPPATAPPATAADPVPVSEPAGPSVPTAEQWAKLRDCESDGSYSIVSGNGLYHGAYQFGTSTWDGTASASGRSDLVGIVPSQASAADQDAMAMVLWSTRGSRPWPHCGKHLVVAS